MLNSRELELFNVVKEALPSWYFVDENAALETLSGFAKQFGAVWDQADLWLNQALILQSFGMWLSAHARDRNTSAQPNETEDALKARLRSVEDVVTPPALLTLVTKILEAEGSGGTPFLVELRLESAYLQVSAITGHDFTHMDTGDRVGPGGVNSIVIILPYGTTADTAAVVADALRRSKAPGVVLYIETRANP